MKRWLRGSFTIEATVIVPIVLFVVGILFYLLFYYHDKNAILSAAHDTVVYGSYMEEVEESDLQNYMREQVNGRLLLFPSAQSSVEIRKEEIAMTVTASRGPMSLKIKTATARTYPERYIRSIQKMKK